MKLTDYSTDTTFNMESLVVPASSYQKSLLATHELPMNNYEARERKTGQNDWMFAILIFCFILVSWNHVYNPKRLIQVLRAPFSRRFVNQLIREGNLFNERITFTLGIVYLLSFSLLFFVVNEKFFNFTPHGFSRIMLYASIVIGLLLFTFLKVILISILGSVFKTRETTYHYLLNLLIFSIITGPIILFFMVFIVYINNPITLYLCLIIIVLLFLIRFFRGFLIGMTLTKFSYLLLFVYLCSLEILPLLVLLKLVLNLAKTATV